MRIVQLIDNARARRVALVEEGNLRLVRECGSVHALAEAAFNASGTLNEAVKVRLSDGVVSYDAVYFGKSPWRLLPALDHPADPARCLVSGTGLTHMASARNRQAMHTSGQTPTDSMRMYDWGVEGGRPQAGVCGVAPEWFYKGPGSVLRAHGDPLSIPSYGEDGGEEPEIAGAYWIDPEGTPRRLGMMQGNEFSDHRFEKRNYLYLAGSKLRNCAIGPELVLEPDFHDITGQVRIERGGAAVWEQTIHSGDASMAHSLANLEHHHFKFEAHRRPGDVHVHFYGADAFSFGAGIALEAGDIMQVSFAGFGRPLRNPLAIENSTNRLIEVRPL
jgi:hypothetical protein